MFARVAARVSRACAMNDSLVASGAVDTKLMWQIPRLALALQCSIPPLDAPCFAVQKSNSNREIAIDATPAERAWFAHRRFKDFDYAEFVEGAAHAYGVLNEVVYRKQTDEDAELLSKTCTPQIARVLAHTANELHAGDAPMTLEASTLARRSLHACVADVFASERERDLEHTLRGYDDELHALDATEREKRIGDIATELFELRKAREESPSSEAEVVSAEFDVLFESHEKMAIDIAGQSLVVEKKQLSTWRFLSPLDEPEWRVCKIF